MFAGSAEFFANSPRRVAQILNLSVSPEIVAAREDFLTTDGHGLTRMKTGFLLSVSIRVHPWLEHIGCGFAALRCIADLQPAGHRPSQTAGDYKSAIRRDTADCGSALLRLTCVGRCFIGAASQPPPAKPEA